MDISIELAFLKFYFVLKQHSGNFVCVYICVSAYVWLWKPEVNHEYCHELVFLRQGVSLGRGVH